MKKDERNQLLLAATLVCVAVFAGVVLEAVCL